MQIKVIMAKITNGNCRLMYSCYINFAAQNHSEVNNLWEIGKKRGKKLWKHEFSEIYELTKNSQCMVHRRRSRSGWSGFGLTTFIQGKNETSFLQKQARNRSASMIFRLVRLIIILYNR